MRDGETGSFLKELTKVLITGMVDVPGCVLVLKSLRLGFPGVSGGGR